MAKAIVLVVDDSNENLLFLDTLLKGADYQVELALSGETALDFLAINTPDIVLLDINMPGMNGLETCQKIRAQEKLSTLPIIFLSGMAGREEEEQVANVGGTGLIGKPYSIMDLLNVINTHLTLSQA